MRDAGFYAHLKSNEMIETAKFDFYTLGVINNSESLADTLCYHNNPLQLG